MAYLPTFENPKEEHVSVASNASGASKGRVPGGRLGPRRGQGAAPPEAPGF